MFEPPSLELLDPVMMPAERIVVAFVELSAMACGGARSRSILVNGQVRVAAGGQVKVPVPRLLLPCFGGPGITSFGAGLAHAE
ncbi:MAG: hypothetical protein ACLPKE_31175 [Streptosporangiaceae bacterium]